MEIIQFYYMYIMVRLCMPLFGRGFSLRLKGLVYESYASHAMLYRSESWCLKEREMGILQSAEISLMGATCRVQLKDKERSKDLMLMLGLIETIDQLTMINSVCWKDHVLRRDDGLVLRMTLDFEVEGQRKKGRLKKIWKKQVEEESVKVGLGREDAHCRSKWSVGVNLIAAW